MFSVARLSLLFFFIGVDNPLNFCSFVCFIVSTAPMSRCPPALAAARNSLLSHTQCLHVTIPPSVVFFFFEIIANRKVWRQRVESVDTVNSFCIDCLFVNCHSAVGKRALTLQLTMLSQTDREVNTASASEPRRPTQLPVTRQQRPLTSRRTHLLISCESARGVWESEGETCARVSSQIAFRPTSHLAIAPSTSPL